MSSHLSTALVLLVLSAACTNAPPPGGPTPDRRSGEPTRVRVALFNIRELKTDKIYDVDADGRGRDPQALAAAEIIQRIRPDILVLNEIDHDYRASAEGLDWSARRFRDAYLAGGSEPLELTYSYAAPNNTGLLSGLDLDGDGHAATDADRGGRTHGNDSWGYGTYPGEYSMAVLSRFPIRHREARTFQRFLWRDLPGHHMPAEHFSAEVAERLRLSSKSHWDVPIEIDGSLLHLFVSHPTPQGFDGPEDKNGRRNFDEIKLWTEYLDGGDSLTNDRGETGGFGSREPFVVVGDLNARPLVPGTEREGPFRTSIYDGRASIDQLLSHPRIQDSGPFVTSAGGLTHNAETPREPGPPGYPERSTSVFGDGARIDYVLPSVELEILGGGVFWPTPAEDPEGAQWAEQASDHRLVWLDLALDVSDP
ncbi:MAG: endonuclease/exonuclease/phosphatase family protein [bacterium]|nr:endonuclease/exonuclease/phosphatase family protein [bacterium]